MKYIFALLIFPLLAFSCDFDGDKINDSFRVKRRRDVYVQLSSGLSRMLKLPEPTSKISCYDSDKDGMDEVVVKKHSRTTAFHVLTPRALKSVCKNIRSLVSSEIWKSKASQHISGGDARSQSTSFIVLRGTGRPRGNCLRGYSSNGTLVHKLGEYSPSGAAYSARFYGGHGCGDKARPSTVRARAMSNGGSPTIYITSGTGNCARIPDPSQCYNSSGC